HIDANDTARLVPVIVDDAKSLVRTQYTGKILRNTAQRLNVRPRDTVLDRTADRRPKLQIFHIDIGPDVILAEHLIELLLEPVSRLQILRNDDHLPEIRICGLHVEGENE